MTKEQLILGVLSALTGIAALVLGLVNRRDSRRREQQDEIDELRDCINELEAEQRVTKKQVQLFWNIVEKEIGNMLHSPHREDLDRLIEANQQRRLSKDEVNEFARLLSEMAENKDVTHGEQTAAVLLKAAVLARHAHVNH